MASPPEFGNAVSGCRTCSGLWLNNEASMAVADGTLHPAVVGLAARVDAHVAEPALASAYRAPAASNGTPACPVCGEDLVRVPISRQRILLDVCARHGTWFDRNELRAVRNALAIEHEEHKAAASGQHLIDAHEQQRVQHVMSKPTHGRAQLTYEAVDWVLNGTDPKRV